MRLNKYIKLLTLLIVATVMTFCFNVVRSAYAESIFYSNDGIINGFISVETIPENVVVPSEINGTPITTLANDIGAPAIAFNDGQVVEKIKTIDLSQAVNLTTISANTFTGCTLEGVFVVPENLKSIGRNNFSNSQFTKVEVLGSEPFTISSSSFKQGQRVVFSSKEIMNDFSETYSAWSQNYDLNYKFVLQVQISQENTIDIGTFETGAKFEEYSEVISTHLSGYENVKLMQGNVEVNSDTILDGSVLTFTGDKKSDVIYDNEDLQFDYKDECIITAPQDGEYVWKFQGNEISTDKSLNLQLDAGTYEYICEVSVGGELTSVTTFTITIKPIKINITWPTITSYELIKVATVDFVGEEVEDLTTINFYKYDSDSQTFDSNPSNFSIGHFKAIVEPIDNKNYVVDNNSFEFDIDYTYLSLVWGANEFNYIGQVIEPTYTLYGEKYGQDVQVIIKPDSELEAIHVGQYTIVVEGLSNECFSLTNTSITTFNWSIIETELNVVWSNNQFSYNGEEKTPTAVGTFEDIEIPLIVNCSDTIKNVGTYNLSVSIPSEYTGFVLTGELTSTCQVVQTVLNITFSYSQPYEYNGEYYEIVPNITGVTEEIELVITGNRYKDAGEYVCKVVGTTDPNYVVNENVELEWKINPKPISVNWKSLSYTYNGLYQRPNPSIDTGIAGETLEFSIESDITINVNEDDTVGYTASVSITNNNYKLINPTTYYRIVRAIPRVENLHTDETLVYTGENILPNYRFVGDEGYLQIFVNGIRTDSGVKDVGVYQLRFYAPQSPNYREMNEYLCILTIKKASIQASTNDTTITVTNTEEGFDEGSIVVIEEVNDYNDTSLTIDDGEGYDIFKVINVESIDGYSNNTLTLDIKNINVSKLRIFVLEGNNLVEKELTITDNKVSFDGGNGTYFILMAKPKWIETTGGIITMIMLLVVVCGVIALPLFMKNKKAKEEDKINKEVAKRLTKLAENGERITSEITEKTRREVIEDIHKKDEKVDN